MQNIILLFLGHVKIQNLKFIEAEQTKCHPES